MDTTAGDAVYRFEGFLIDVARGLLLHDTGEEVQLRRKSFELLRLFAENSGALLDRDRINQAIWPDVVVDDNGLTQCIRDIRRVLHDEAQKIIRTVPRRGYIFTSKVTTVARQPGSRSTNDALPLPDKPSIAVLPFQNMSGDPDQEYFSDGIAEDITTALSRVRSLFVIARNSAFAYKGTSPDIRKISRELGVRYVLEGSVRKYGHRVRITVQLIETESGTHIWADRFDGSLDDVFDLQDRITASVVAKIAPMVRNAEIQRAQRAPTNNPQAYDLLLRAMSHYRSWTRAGYEEAVRLLRQAITIDPNYALGYAHLSAILWMMCSQGWVDRSDPTVADMLDLARTALTLDGEDPEVLIMVGSATALPGGDFNGGIAMINKAIALNPNSAVAFRTAGGLYARAGDSTRAFASFDQAERLDPLDYGPSGYSRQHSGQIVAHFVTGAYDAALECCDKSLRDRPRSAAPLRYRAACLGLLGRLEEARQTVQRLRELVPDFTIARARRHIEFDMNNLFGKPSDRAAFYEGLRRAGVPE
jgi:TolB-like protein